MYISCAEMDEVLVLIIQEALSLLDFASSIKANRKSLTSRRTVYNESSIKHFHNVRKTQVRALHLVLHQLSWSLVQYDMNTILLNIRSRKRLVLFA